MALWPRTRLCYTGGMAAVRKLADNQLQTFSHRDYIPDSLFDGIVQMVGENFKDGDFSFLDAGGGPGLFTDRLLERFPKSRGAVLDNSELLLSENTSNERKLLVLASATDMSAELVDRRFDIIFFNLSLHHFIGKTYSETRRNQRNALAQAVSLLAPAGRVVVTENLYDGIVIDNLPGWIVYMLTASGFLAPLVKRLGANTAGCGVCYLSAGAWRKEFRRAGLRDCAFSANVWKERRLWRAMCFWLMSIRSISTGYFWLQPQPAESN